MHHHGKVIRGRMPSHVVTCASRLENFGGLLSSQLNIGKFSRQLGRSLESIHIPRYLMLLAGINVLVSFSVFMGIVIDGPGPTCLPLLDLVKWMSLHFTWSVLSPLFLSHSWAVSKAVFMI